MADEQQTPFDLAFNYTIKNEGGFSDNRSDAGGATKAGITLKTLSRWLGRPASVAEVKSLSLAEAKAIYKAYYWNPLGLDDIKHTGVAMALFDVGVVRGIGIPPKYAQEICLDHGIQLAQDGHIGPVTLAAINSFSTLEFVTDFKTKVDAGFEAIAARSASQKVFLQGWLSRSKRLLSLTIEPDLLPILGTPPVEKPQTPQTPAPVTTKPLAQASFVERLKLAFQVLFRA